MFAINIIFFVVVRKSFQQHLLMNFTKDTETQKPTADEVSDFIISFLSKKKKITRLHLQ